MGGKRISAAGDSRERDAGLPEFGDVLQPRESYLKRGGILRGLLKQADS